MMRYAWLLLLLARVAASQTEAPARPDDLLAAAKQAYAQQGPAAALPKFEKVLTLYRSGKDQRSEAITLGYIANCHRRLGNLKQALDLAQKALAMKENLGDRNEVGTTHNQLGLIYWDLADYPSAIKELQQAIEIGESLGDAQLEGSALNNLGLVFDERGDYQQSLPQYRRALELHRSSHFERGEGDALGNIGGVSLMLGRFSEALQYYRQALAISQRLGLKPAEADDLGDIALCLKGIGEIDESVKTFDQALQIAHEAGLTKEEADWHRGKGSALAGLGRYDAALKEFSKAQQAYERSGLRRELVDSLNDTGRVYELLGDLTSADKAFHQALEVAQGIGNGAGVIASMIALGDLERRRKQYDAAENYFSRALESARAAGDEGNMFEALIDRSRNDLDRKRLDYASSGAAEASRVVERNANRPAMAVARYIEGEISRVRGEFQQALAMYSSAEDLQSRFRDPELGWRILFGRGQTLEVLGKDQEALAAYQASIELVEQTRAAIAEERFRAGYIEERFQVYVALVELLLKLGKPADAFYYSEKLRARAYFDQLGRSDAEGRDLAGQQRARELRQQMESLREKIEKEYSVTERERRGRALEIFSKELEQAQRAYEEILDTVRGASPFRKSLAGIPDTGDIQRLLPSGTALVEYVVGKQTLSILTVKKDSVNGTTVQIGAESLATRTELLRDLIMERKPAWIDPGRGLQALLIAPLDHAGYLRGVQRLIVVPDGVLNYVPFAALPTSGSRVLGDDFIVAYLPAAVALLAERSADRGGRAMLAMAPAESHLPNAGAEVRSIGEMFPRGSLVTAGKGATKTLFKQVAGQYDYVHLATHGSLNRNAPWLSTLQLQPDDQNDGLLELHEILDLKLHARLVTLSACETALGSGYFTDTPAGDEFVGMTRAFLGAGSQSVLASLWAVNDESTRALMVKFYRYLRQFDGPEALMRAQREFRRSEQRYRAPYYWAAFVLVGVSKIGPEKGQ
jgi:CHAT domain-containing protein/Tfp pilus assembly protein PilF